MKTSQIGFPIWIDDVVGDSNKSSGNSVECHTTNHPRQKSHLLFDTGPAQIPPNYYIVGLEKSVENFCIHILCIWD